MSGIFISYRRGETGAIAGRIADRLIERFGESNVFMDVNAIQPGADFVNRIEEAVGACEALVVVIGPGWETEQDSSGQRRIDNPEDFVVLEVKAGLERDVLVIPVLVNGAAMPNAEQLPPALASLSRRNALQVSDVRFRDDVGHLIETIQAVMPTHEADEAPTQATIPPSLRIQLGQISTSGWLLFGGATAVFLGSLLPWADVSDALGISVSSKPRSGGVLVFVILAAGALTLGWPELRGSLSKRRWIGFTVVVALLTLFAITNWSELGNLQSQYGGDGTQVNAGFGLYLYTIGVAAFWVFAIRIFRARRRRQAPAL